MKIHEHLYGMNLESDNNTSSDMKFFKQQFNVAPRNVGTNLQQILQKLLSAPVIQGRIVFIPSKDSGDVSILPNETNWTYFTERY